jgi:hypothetical protein
MTSSTLRLLADGRWAQPMMAYVGCFVPMCWVLGRKSGRLHMFCYQFGGGSHSGLPTVPDEWVSGAVSLWRNSVKSSYAQMGSTPSHAPRGKPASMKSSLMPTLSPVTSRNKGIEIVAVLTGAPAQCVASRSSADYAARDGPGDPRGRKSGAGLPAANPR